MMTPLHDPLASRTYVAIFPDEQALTRWQTTARLARYVASVTGLPRSAPGQVFAVVSEYATREDCAAAVAAEAARARVARTLYMREYGPAAKARRTLVAAGGGEEDCV